MSNLSHLSRMNGTGFSTFKTFTVCVLSSLSVAHSVVLKEHNGEYAPVRMYFMYGCQEGAKQAEMYAENTKMGQQTYIGSLLMSQTGPPNYSLCVTSTLDLCLIESGAGTPLQTFVCWRTATNESVNWKSWKIRTTHSPHLCEHLYLFIYSQNL